MPKMSKVGIQMITTLAGPNYFLLQTELKRRVAAFVADHGDLALERLDGEEVSVEAMSDSLESQTLLSAKKLVVLRRPSANQSFLEKFEDILQKTADSTEVIIVEPKLDKRFAYYKWLKKHTDFHDYTELDARELPTWLVAEAKKTGGSLSGSAARYLVEQIGPNQQLLSMELEKLLQYDLIVTREVIDLLVEPLPQSTIFQLLDAVFTGNARRTLKIYKEQRRQKVEPLAIIGMIAWQLHVLAVVKTAGDRSGADIAKTARLNPYVVQKTQAIARQLTLPELRQLVRQVADLDVGLKSTSIDADDALEQLLVDIAALHSRNLG